MGAIRSFDGRNCDWFTPARCPVRMVRLSVATPWPPCWLIKYTRAVSVQYVQYSVGTPWPHLDVVSYTVAVKVLKILLFCEIWVRSRSVKVIKIALFAKFREIGA